MMWGEKKLKKGDEGEKRSEIEGCGELVEERRNDEDIELRKDKFGKDKIEIDEERDRRLKRKWINEGKKEENDISYEDRNVEGDGKNKGMNGWKVEKEWGKKVIEKEYMKKNWSEEYEDDEEEDKGIEGDMKRVRRIVREVKKIRERIMEIMEMKRLVNMDGRRWGKEKKREEKMK